MHNFHWTSLQVNVCTISSEHEDENFLNDSLLLVFGDFLGGEFVHNDIVWPLKGEALRFDGSITHSSMPFEGTRYSIVAVTHKAWANATSDLQHQLLALVFSPPVGEGNVEPLSEDKDRLELVPNMYAKDNYSEKA